MAQSLAVSCLMKSTFKKRQNNNMRKQFFADYAQINELRQRFIMYPATFWGWHNCRCNIHYYHCLKFPLWSPHYNTLTIFSLSLPQYFVLLLCIFLLEILAGVLAYVYYQQVIPLVLIKFKKAFQIHFTVHSKISILGWNSWYYILIPHEKVSNRI